MGVEAGGRGGENSKSKGGEKSERRLSYKESKQWVPSGLLVVVLVGSSLGVNIARLLLLDTLFARNSLSVSECEESWRTHDIIQ